MWKAVSTRRDPSDPEFVSWLVKAENDDGRERTVMVRIETSVVTSTSWTTGKGHLRHVRDAMESRGVSLIESRRDRGELPMSIVYRSGAEDFVEE